MQLRNLHNAALVLLAACAVPSFAAGWSTNAWPSEEYPRETYRQLSECYTGILERCKAANMAELPDAPSWWRSNRGALVGLKTYLARAGIGDRWVVTNSMSDLTTGAATWLTANLGTNFPVYAQDAIPSSTAWTSLCVRLQIPTNYFSYTPYRCLTGIGPFTTDATAPYPHGWTNASTAAGGTAFPSGRACWYTTDYGWNQLPKILNALTATWVAGTMDNTNVYQESSSVRTNWTLAKASAESGYSQKYATGGRDWWGSTGSKDYSFYTPELNMARHTFRVSLWHRQTNATPRIDFHFYPRKHPDYVISEYDDHGAGWTEAAYNYAGTNATWTPIDDVSTYARTALWGSTNLPTWCQEPPSNSTNTFRGFAIDTSGTRPVRATANYAVPGGFKFY